MVIGRNIANTGAGLRAPVRLALSVALVSVSVAAISQPRPATPAQAQATIPDTLLAARLVWSAMAALDHANRTGNYSVLRDLGAPSFQANNSAATLGSIFEELRRQRIDLSNTLIVSPNLEFPPTFVQGGLLRIRGSFPLRPVAVGFDLLFQNIGGEWKIFGIAVVPQAPRPVRT
ncbi:MAG: hypothetical protein ACXWU2_00755 [Allosphingosinicella sp.]